MNEPNQPDRAPTPARPTPVRQGRGSRNEAEVPAETESFVAEGQEWTARVVGRSGGTSDGAAPMLLVGFHRGGDGPEEPILETLVPAKSLSGLGPDGLAAALAAATPPRASDEKAPFFKDTGRGRGR